MKSNYYAITLAVLCFAFLTPVQAETCPSIEGLKTQLPQGWKNTGLTRHYQPDTYKFLQVTIVKPPGLLDYVVCAYRSEAVGTINIRNFEKQKPESMKFWGENYYGHLECNISLEACRFIPW